MLESARTGLKQGRYSLVAASSKACFRSRSDQSIAPWQALRRLCEERGFQDSPEYPLFAGGAVGFVGYEAKSIFEPTLSVPKQDDLALPWLYFLLIEEGLLLDHHLQKCFVFSVNSSRVSADKKMDGLEQKLRRAQKNKSKNKPQPSRKKFLPKSITSSVSKKQFCTQVQAVKRYIQRGDIFQANLSQRLSFPLTEPIEEIYARLKKVNPSSFFGILDAGDFQILSGSPERLLKLERGKLETRPIAGTRPRSINAQEDKALSLELLLSEKERAEHIMLVDLERNDLGRVAEYGSVRVEDLMGVEEYSHVRHIVSTVTADLKTGLSPFDAFAAFFPGGTITGAPKIRSMQIIDELESMARGPYTGSLGYFSFTGSMDFNIIIRSLVVKDGVAHLQVGAGIVADSDPEKEYEETLYKAEAVLSAIFGPEHARTALDRLRSS